MEVKAGVWSSIKVTTKNATNVWNKFLEHHKLEYEYNWRINWLKNNKVPVLMGRFKNYHWNRKKLKKQTNLEENGLELSVGFYNFVSYSIAFWFASFFQFFQFSCCKPPVKNWQVILIYLNISLAPYPPCLHFVCNLGLLSIVLGRERSFFCHVFL